MIRGEIEGKQVNEFLVKNGRRIYDEKKFLLLLRKRERRA